MMGQAGELRGSGLMPNQKGKDMNQIVAGSVGLAPTRQKAADQIAQMLENIKNQSIDLSARTAELLSGVTSQPGGNDKEAVAQPPMIADLPPLFAAYRAQLEIIQINLLNINRTLDRLEL